MAASTNQQILFKSRPEGMPTEDNFEMVETPLPPVGPGQMLRRTIWLSVDPYMRGRMSGIRTYVGPYELGDTIEGGAVGRVVASNDPGFSVRSVRSTPFWFPVAPPSSWTATSKSPETIVSAMCGAIRSCRAFSDGSRSAWSRAASSSDTSNRPMIVI